MFFDQTVLHLEIYLKSIIIDMCPYLYAQNCLSQKWIIIVKNNPSVNNRGLFRKTMTHPYIMILYNQNKGFYKERLMIERNDHEILCK